MEVRVSFVLHPGLPNVHAKNLGRPGQLMMCGHYLGHERSPAQQKLKNEYHTKFGVISDVT